MTENPYQPTRLKGEVLSARGAKRLANTLIALGAGAMALAVVGAGVIVLRIARMWQAIAESADAPMPAELAEGISWSITPSIVVPPLAIGGMILLVVGLALRVRAGRRA